MTRHLAIVEDGTVVRVLAEIPEELAGFALECLSGAENFKITAFDRRVRDMRIMEPPP